MERLQRRQSVFSFANSWVYQPDIVLGITLGIKATEDPSSLTWMAALIEEGLKRSNVPLMTRLMWTYALVLLRKSPNSPRLPSSHAEFEHLSMPELALSIWLARRGVLEVPADAHTTWLEQGSASLIERLITESPYEVTDYKAAIIWEAAAAYIEARSHFPRLDLVRTVLSNFSAAMERWKEKWSITDEYDVQSVLWLMLRPYFDGLKYEEYLPKFGRSGQRFDIGIPEMGLIVEAKYIRRKSDFQKIVDEIGKDSAQLQPQSVFKDIIVFVYDEICAVEEHDWTRRTLSAIALVKDVLIVCAPSVCRKSLTISSPGVTRKRRVPRAT